MQVATTATFAACALEALRMLLADLEQPGGTLTTPIKAPMALLLPIAIGLFPVVLPAGLIGKMVMCCCHVCCCRGVLAVMFAAIMCAVVIHALHRAASFEVQLQLQDSAAGSLSAFLNVQGTCCH